MSTSPMTPVTAVAESASPTPPPVEHMPHGHQPGDPPTQLSSEHANVVNYAISAGGVVLGVALITTFALICRWRKRRRQRELDDQIDERIREKSLSRLEANRTHSLVKIPAAALASEHSVLRPLPQLTAHRGMHSANSSEETLSCPRSRQTCPSGTAPEHGTVRYSSSRRQPRAVSSFVRGRHSPLRPALRALSLGSSASRSSRRTDENIHRASSIRSPSPRVASPYDYGHSFRHSAVESVNPAITYSRRGCVGMGIVVATTAGTLGCPSPALTTPSLGFSTPRTGTSTSGSPALSLSDDSGATTLNPIVVFEHNYEHSPTTSNSPAADRPLTSVDVSASRDHLRPSLAHMQVSPVVQNTAGSPVVSVYASPRSSSSAAPSPQAPAIEHWQKPSLSGVPPEAFKTGEIPFSPRAEEEAQHQGWFTEVDWFGADGPLASRV